MLATRLYAGVTKWILFGLAFTLGLVLLKETTQRLITQVQPNHEKVHPLPPIYPKPATPDNNEAVVTFIHLTTTASAQAILEHGLQPLTGARSGNDARFFAFTQERGPYPRPTNKQIEEMLSTILLQLRESYLNVDVALVYLRIPKKEVISLESKQLIHYGSFFPASAPGYTETIFELPSFSTVNQYKHLWNYQQLVVK